MPGSPPGALLDYTQDKVVLLDASGQYTYANEATERLLGYEPNELVGTNAFEYIHPEDTIEVRTAFERTIEASSVTESAVRYRHQTSDDTFLWLESRMSNVTDDDLDGYVVCSRDISDRVEAERERWELTERFHDLASATDDVLWMFDGDWSELLFVNPAIEDVYGLSVAEVRRDPQRFLDVVHPEDVSAVEAAMARLSNGIPADMEYRVNPAENYQRYVWVQAKPIARNGETVRIVGFTRDVTARRRRERQLVVMDNLLRHNLRNNLNIISGTARLIEDEMPEASDRTAVIRRTAEDLLASAEKEREVIEMLTGDPGREEFDLVPTVGRCIETIRRECPSATVETSLPETAAVFAVPELEAAITELLENAICHADSDRPRIELSVQVGAESVELVSKDCGPPIPPIEADVLRGDHEMTHVYHSSGLGFWLVYWTVELSQGSVSVERSTADGNRIALQLPRPSN
ncbi:PAS domain-containing sensor histidine kinase [Halobellus sp. Atlit-31R]|nr:PAS domain-containing sensor histidine kinase [Halobellus sp. Atlit-31R]